METIIITSTALAKKLIKNGFVVVDIFPHKHNKDRTVFIFEDTHEIKAFLNKDN